MSKSGFCKATPAVEPGFRSRKANAFAPPAFKSDSKSDELKVPEKGNPAPSHVSAPALVESTLALKYNKTDLIKILKIFLETKSQEPKAEVPCEQPLKAKVPDVYFGKLHMDCYHFCHQCKDYFKIADTTRSNHTLFAILFLCEKINF